MLGSDITRKKEQEINTIRINVLDTAAAVTAAVAAPCLEWGKQNHFHQINKKKQEQIKKVVKCSPQNFPYALVDLRGWILRVYCVRCVCTICTILLFVSGFRFQYSFVVIWHLSGFDMINHCHAFGNHNRHTCFDSCHQRHKQKWICDQFS